MLTSVSPLAALIGGLVGAGKGEGGVVAGSVVGGLLGTGLGIGLIVYGAHRLTPAELEERRKAGPDVGAAVPVVSIGAGSVQASWTF